ncbi:MAG: ATP-binding protein [Chloroflexia bacterium]
MTASDLIQYSTWAVYVLIFVSTAVKAVRRPLRANIDIALFFLIIALIILQTVLQGLGIEPRIPIITAFNTSLIPLMGYMLLRLVDDFSNVPGWFMRVAEAALALLVIGIFVFPTPLPTWFSLVFLAYMIGLILYSSVAFVRQARMTRGVTSRRMSAAAAGCIFFCAVFAIATVGIAFPQWRSGMQVFTSVAALASGICYFLGFAPPAVLRSAWQEPELRAFLGRAASLPRLSTTEAIVAQLERGAASSIGTPRARIGLWDESEQALRFDSDEEGETSLIPANDDSITGRTFLNQEPTFTDNLLRDSPRAARQGGTNRTRTLLAAPITTEGRRLGVLVAYADHVPIFADEDMRLIKLLADQAAVILESRALIDEATRVRGREEATRLKEDFLSAAAHDLKTPLTTLVAQAQLLERRAERKPDMPVDREAIRTIAREATRLKNLVLELLDAARAEEGKLLGEMEEFDLVAVAQEVCARHNSERHACSVRATGPVEGTYDLNRIRQLLENLVENAVKYSPEGGEVLVKLWAEGTRAFISVRDQGIGIPQADLPHVFERFHRGANVDDRRFAGMGLGLYICREIVEQHGGKMKVASRRSEGTTFTVELPLRREEAPQEAAQADARIGVTPGPGQTDQVEAAGEASLPNLLAGQMPFGMPEKGQST